MPVSSRFLGQISLRRLQVRRLLSPGLLSGAKSFAANAPAFVVAGFAVTSSSDCFGPTTSGTGCGTVANQPNNSGCTTSGCIIAPTAGGGFTLGPTFSSASKMRLGRVVVLPHRVVMLIVARRGTEATIAQSGFSPTSFPFASGVGASNQWGMGAVEIWAILRYRDGFDYYDYFNKYDDDHDSKHNYNEHGQRAELRRMHGH